MTLISAWGGRFGKSAALFAVSVAIGSAVMTQVAAHNVVQDEARPEAVAIDGIDPTSENGRLALHYRIGAEASDLCTTSGDQKASQYRACVQLAVEEADKTCRHAAATCTVRIAPFARIPTKPRPTFGPRSM